jgi:TRAP-type C4-dicarboxylate transport system substrate-binding protein
VAGQPLFEYLGGEFQVRKRILTVLIGITLVMTMIFGLLPACGGGTTTPPPGGSVPPGGTTPAPTAAGQTFQWRWQTTGNAGTATYWTFEELSANIKAASGGRLTLDNQPQGAIVGVMEIFDAVSTGAIEVGSACD